MQRRGPDLAKVPDPPPGRQVPGGGSMDEGWDQVTGQVHCAEALSRQSSKPWAGSWIQECCG